MPTQIVAKHVVSHVTVYEDRADVTRRADVDVPAGAVTIVIKAVSPLVEEGRLTARVEGADGHVDDVVIDRRFDVDLDAVTRRRQGRAADREARTIDREAAVGVVAGAEQRRRTVESLAKSQAQARARRVGRGEIDLDGIEHDVASFQQAVVAADDAVVEAKSAVLRIDAALAAIGDDDDDDDSVEHRRVCDLHVRLSSPGGLVTIVVSTVVPCAAWRPSHEAQLTRDTDLSTSGSVRIVGHGAVWNRTGEDWKSAAVTLSTARPSAGAALPALTADRLRLRTKTVEERRQIVVAHRTEAVPKDASRGGAPGVDDGGEVRAFVVHTATILDDGRPHRLELFSFTAPCALVRYAVPEKASQVFVRASFKNAGRSPLLAGPVSLSDNGAFIGVGDILYTGVGDDLDLAFGSDDDLRVTYERKRIDESRLVGKDLQHWVQAATVTSTRRTATPVQVLLRLPVSELAQVKIIQSPQHGTVGEIAPDSHGLVRVDAVIEPGADKRLAVAFVFDTSGDVVLPPPW